MDEHDFTLGVDLACSAAHVATLADAAGRLVWSNHRFRTTTVELERLWAKVPAGARLQLVIEPTRNAWVPLAAWFRARGVTVILVPPEQSTMRRYYQKHTKNDRLDSVLLARLPLLHPNGLNVCRDLGRADPLRRTVRRRAKLVRQRITSLNRLTALLELLGPGYNDAFSGGLTTKTAQALLSRYADPASCCGLRRSGWCIIFMGVSEASRGQHGPILVNQLRGAAAEAMALYGMAGVDFAELAADIEAEMRSIMTVQAQIDQLDTRIQRLYLHADPDQIVQTTPGVGPVLAPAIHGLFGDPHRFANLAAARAFTGLVPDTNESGISQARARPTKAGDPGLGPPCSWPPTWPGRPTPHWPPSTVGSSWSASCTTTLRSATSRRFSPPASWLVFAPAPPIRSADSTDRPSPPPKAESSAKDSRVHPHERPRPPRRQP